jgi:hypothetical protein
MLNNPKDPLHQQADAENALFSALAKVANGFTSEQVVGAALNLVVNAIRQANASDKGALDAADAAHAAMRKILVAHYDNAGKRRNIFPFHQVIEMPFLDLRKKG